MEEDKEDESSSDEVEELRVLSKMGPILGEALQVDLQNDQTMLAHNAYLGSKASSSKQSHSRSSSDGILLPHPRRSLLNGIKKQHRPEIEQFILKHQSWITKYAFFSNAPQGPEERRCGEQGA